MPNPTIGLRGLPERMHRETHTSAPLTGPISPITMIVDNALARWQLTTCRATRSGSIPPFQTVGPSLVGTFLLSRFMKDPETHNWLTKNSALRYVAGTQEICLRYWEGSRLTGAANADYGGCPTTRRSTTGWAFTLNGAAFYWSSNRQPTVAGFTAEAEYIVAAAATKEAL